MFENYGNIQEPAIYLNCEKADSGLFAVLNNNNRYAFIDFDDTSSITTVQCDNVEIIKDTYAILVEKNHFGLYELGGFLYPCIYDDIQEYYGGFLVSVNNKFGYLFGGKTLISCEYDNIEIIPDEEYINHEIQHHNYGHFLRVEKEGRYGLIDLKGNVLLNPTYESIMEVGLYVEIMAELDGNYVSNIYPEDTYRYLVLVTEELKLFDCLERRIITLDSSNNLICGNKIYFDRLR